MDITIGDGTVITINLPGATAVRIDTTRRIIAVDGVSTSNYHGGPEFTVHDLRRGVYGGFHRLGPASECFDPAGCSGNDVDPADRRHVAGEDGTR